jgi:hypothetical protein
MSSEKDMAASALKRQVLIEPAASVQYSPEAEASVAVEVRQAGHLDLVSTHDPFQDTRMELSQSPKKSTSQNEPLRERSSGEGDGILSAQERLARASEHVAECMNTTFSCSAGVQTALADLGMDFYGCGDAWQMGQALQDSGKFEVIPESQVRRGDIGVQAWSDETIRRYASQYHGRNLGDIFVVQHVANGQITQTNDHEQGFDPDSHLYDPSKRYFLRIMS